MVNAYNMFSNVVAVYLGPEDVRMTEDIRMTNLYSLIPRAVAVYL
jgi:hypothetical protein